MSEIAICPQSAPPVETSWPAQVRERDAIWKRPEVLVVALSTLFGILIVALNPPLRGPDEAAHFLRAYAIAQGEILPSVTDGAGRRGAFLPAQLKDDLDFFERTRYHIYDQEFSYRAVMADFFRRRAARVSQNGDDPPGFDLYAGSEAYTPLVYLPYVMAALVGRAFDLDFIALLYAMRLAGLAFGTALAAYAIAIVPRLKWAFFLTAMLPAALYGRSIVSVDGSTIGFAMIVTALCLKAAANTAGQNTAERAFWMILCVLAKPAQLVFLLLEAMTSPLKQLRRQWRSRAAVVLPGLLLMPVWVLTISADVGTWRIVEGTGLPAQEFDPVWKLRYLLKHPLHFLQASLVNLDATPGLFRQLIGVLGWLDTPLLSGVYPLLGSAVLAVCLERLDIDRGTRIRIAAISWMTVLGYVVAVFVIFFLIWTPLRSARIEGLQGRYFLVVLPVAAIGLGALLPSKTPPRALRAAALAGTLLAGIFLIWMSFQSELADGQGRYFLVLLSIAAIGLAALLPGGLPPRAIRAVAIAGGLLAGAAILESLLRVDWRAFS